MSNFVNLLDIVYPVGSIYHSMDATSPVDFIGGTWTKIKTFLYGADTANQTGGEATHTLTVNEMPAHGHGINLHYADNSGYNTGHTSYWAAMGQHHTGQHQQGGSAQQLAALHNLLHLVQDIVATLKANCLNLSEVAHV